MGGVNCGSRIKSTSEVAIASYTHFRFPLLHDAHVGLSLPHLTYCSQLSLYCQHFVIKKFRTRLSRYDRHIVVGRRCFVYLSISSNACEVLAMKALENW